MSSDRQNGFGSDPGRETETNISPGEPVTFSICGGSKQIQVKVLETTKTKDGHTACVVEYVEDNEDLAEIEISADLLTPVLKDPLTNEDTASTTGENISTRTRDNAHIIEQVEEDGHRSENYQSHAAKFLKGKSDRGDREKLHIATTLITDVIKDLNSQNSHAAREILQSYIHSCSNTFTERVHTMTSDQEFMPSLYRMLFLSLHLEDKDNKLPLVLPLAMGHAIKAMACSLMTFYSQGEVDLTVDENFEMSAEDDDWMIQDIADANVDGDILI